jgi:hypothetical protein
MQHKTQRPLQFEITATTRDALQVWIKHAGLKPDNFLFPSRIHDSPQLGTRQYAGILGHWVDELGLDRADYGTHSMCRTKAAPIYRRTKNLRAEQLLLAEGVGGVRPANEPGVGTLLVSYVAPCWNGVVGQYHPYERYALNGSFSLPPLQLDHFTGTQRPGEGGRIKGAKLTPLSVCRRTLPQPMHRTNGWQHPSPFERVLPAPPASTVTWVRKCTWSPTTSS